LPEASAEVSVTGRRRGLTDPARYALQMLTLLESWHVPRERVLAAAGLDNRWVERMRGDERLTMNEVEPLFRAARDVCARSDLGFEFGLMLKPTAHGLLGYGLIGSANLDAALQIAMRQQHHLTEAFALHYERHAGGGRARFTPLVEMTEDRLHFNLEILDVCAQVTLQLLLAGRSPTFEIRLSMPAPPHRRRYLELLPTRFRFEPGSTPGVDVMMERRLLLAPLPMFAPGMVNTVEKHLQPLLPRSDDGVRLSAAITQILSNVEGVQVSIKSVATRLGMSPRTVDRRLADERTSFSALRDAVRFERARQMLAEDLSSVAQIAARLGYRDAANFSRAFRRHCGVTPSEYRQLQYGEA
jgi:AraC-like DNA-binding protein